MVGVNKYPNLMETVSEDILNLQNKIDDPKILVRQRAGLEMEKLRYNTEHFTVQKGYRPIVEIASFGQLTMRKARAAFAYDFMGIGAFEIESEKSFNSYKEAADNEAAYNAYLEQYIFNMDNHQDLIGLIGKNRIEMIKADPKTGYAKGLDRK